MARNDVKRVEEQGKTGAPEGKAVKKQGELPEPTRQVSEIEEITDISCMTCGTN